jgi:uncharacterized iron-regulated protein
LTPAQFKLLEEDYWSKMELQESFTASIQAQIHTLWNAQNCPEGQKPEVVETRQYMTTLLRKLRPGWIKTDTGWITEEEFQRSEQQFMDSVEG